MTKNLAHPVAIFIRGLPGSGKSHLAAGLADRLGSDRAMLLDPDAIDYESEQYRRHVQQMAADGVDPTLHAYRFLRARAYQAIEDRKIIIWDQPFRNLEIFHKMLGRLDDHAAAHHTTLDVLVVEVEIDPTLAKARVAQRKAKGGHGPSEATFDRFKDELKSFDDQEFIVVKVNGSDPLKQSAEEVVAALEPLL